MKSGKPCIYFVAMYLPEVNWIKIIGVLIVPLVPLVLFFVGGWILKGFVKAAQ